MPAMQSAQANASKQKSSSAKKKSPILFPARNGRSEKQKQTKITMQDTSNLLNS
jgi:hypothetical protein